MKEFVITNEMRDKLNNYLGYELIKRNEVGHHIYDEAPGLGRIGIEGNDVGHIFTNKQLDLNGNIEWHKGPNRKANAGEIKPFHCKLTSVSSQKSKIVIASLFPEEIVDPDFFSENKETIEELRKGLNCLKQEKKYNPKEGNYLQYHPLILGPNDTFYEGAYYMYNESEKEEQTSPLLYGPNEMLL